jgi:hypothetical protein
MVDDEVYLGGFASANLTRGFMGGYGIYATNKRIIGVKGIAATSRGGMIASALVGGVVGSALQKKFTDDKIAKMIQELDEKKDFEISIDQISQIEIKKGSFMKKGQLMITPKSGDAITIKVYGNNEFSMTRDLMQSFFQELVKVIE